MPSLERKPSNPSANYRPPSRQSPNGNHLSVDKANQFPYNQSSHGPMTQLHTHWNGNPPGGNQNPKTRPNPFYQQNRFQQRIQQPSLINLDRTDLTIPLFQYPLMAGVTMLGTGKGTVKPPDIVLHGPQIAPQHAFIERLGSEVILHPISELTTIDQRQVHGPTPLEPGNLISIGESYFFRYDGPPPPSPFYNGPHIQADQILYEESPYAIINPRSAGDVNKNSFPTMNSPDCTGLTSSASSITLESESQVCHPDQSFQSFQSPRSSSASTTTSDPGDQTSSLYTEDSGSRKYRDGLESEHFVNKIARFECLANTLPPPPNSSGYNGVIKTSPRQGNVNGSLSNCCGTSLVEGYGERRGLSRPNVNFNRSDQGYGSIYSGYAYSSNNSTTLQDDSSLSSSSVSPPDRIQKYQRPGVTFYEDGQQHLTSPSPASFGFLTDLEETEQGDEESFVNHLSSSYLPTSPDSLSSISNHRHPMRKDHFHQNGGEQERSGSSTSTSSSIIPHHQFNHYNNNHGEQHSSFNGNKADAEIACETLLQIKRKQTEEARLSSEMTRKQDQLRLDELVGMCEDYVEQIAKEIEEKRQNCASASSLSVTGSDAVDSSSVAPTSVNYNRQGELNNWKREQDQQMPNSKSPTTSAAGVYNYGRIKTNGSLPRDLTKNKSFFPASVSNRSNVSFVDQEISSIFTFNVTDNKTESFSSSLNGSNSINGYYNGMPDDVFSPPLNNSFTHKSDVIKAHSLRSGTSPYENVTTNSTNPDYPPLHIQSPPRLGTRATAGMSNGRAMPDNANNLQSYQRELFLKHSVESISSRPQDLTLRPIPLNCSSTSTVKTRPVSPANNRNDNNVSREKVEQPAPTPPKSKLSVSFANSVKEFGDKSETDNKRIEIGSDTKEKCIVKTIATEVQVHVASSNNSCNNDNEGATRNKNSSSPNNVNNCSSSGDINQLIQHPPAISISVNTLKVEDGVRKPCSSSSLSTNVSQTLSQNEVKAVESNSVNNKETTTKSESCHTSSFTFPALSSFCEDRVAVLRKEIREIEEQEMESIREMELEKALLVGEEKSLENQLVLDNEDLVGLKDRLVQIDESNRRWKADGLERISELKAKLMCAEKELQRLERMHEEFCGNTDEDADEEIYKLQRLKFQHELVESDRKTFEDAEFHHMEEEINKEAQREELSKLIAEKGKKFFSLQFQLEKVRSHNRISFSSATKELQSLEKKRQELLQELRKTRESSKPSSDKLCIPGSSDGNISDFEDSSNTDLEEKLQSLCLISSTDDEMHILRIKSRSPIDPHMGANMGPKTCETLREIERNREYLLNEQGVQMLEEERARVRELQKRVQDAVREEWEASRKSRSNQCHSLNSVGSEESGHTASDTPTDSGSGDDTTDKSAAPSISTTDVSLTENGHNPFELCQQMRQKQREMSESFEESRPLSSEASEMGFDENGSTTIVTRRDKSRVHIQQNRPLTRYLPVRGDEDEFDLRAHIESSGHQLELCPHVIVTPTSARGFLSKLGSRFHNWNRRFFVFDREKRALVYYSSDKNEKKSKSRGGIHFEAIEEVYVDHLQSVKSPVPKLTFCVKTHSRVFYLLAPSPEAMRMWIDIIFTGAEGYKEFKCTS